MPASNLYRKFIGESSTSVSITIPFIHRWLYIYLLKTRSILYGMVTRRIRKKRLVLFCFCFVFFLIKFCCCFYFSILIPPPVFLLSGTSHNNSSSSISHNKSSTISQSRSFSFFFWAFMPNHWRTHTHTHERPQTHTRKNQKEANKGTKQVEKTSGLIRPCADRRMSS